MARAGDLHEYSINAVCRILCLELKPDENAEQEVSDEFQVSRTPVREVFVQLLQDELVEIYPQRGTMSLINPAS